MLLLLLLLLVVVVLLLAESSCHAVAMRLPGCCHARASPQQSSRGAWVDDEVRGVEARGAEARGDSPSRAAQGLGTMTRSAASRHAMNAKSSARPRPWPGMR